MTGWLASLQPVLLAAVLAWSGRVKLTSRTARQRATKGALAGLIGKDRVPAAYVTLGAVEVGTAVLLLAGGISAAVASAGPLRPVAAVAAGALSVGFLGYLTYARLFAPDSSCGCMSARQVPIGPRSFVRAGLMLVAAVLAGGAATAWPTGLTAHPIAGIGLLVAEVAVVVGCSPEADRSWLFPLRRFKARLFPHPLAGMAYDLPLASTLQQLERSTAYRQVGTSLRSDVLDHWDSDEWRIVCYRAMRDEGPATAVFAVPRLRYAPDEVRVVFVDEEAEAPAMA